MILLVDNYDSFVYNLARYVRELGDEAVVRRNDRLTIAEVSSLAPSHIILSPGPCSPAEAGISTDIVRRFGPTIPILGVCLGHQCIGAAYGAEIVRAGRPVHGRTSAISHEGTSIFAGLPSPLHVARYHSLVIDRTSPSASLRAIAWAVDDGEIMAVEHETHPVIGVQFHPESAASEYGYAMLDRFMRGPHARTRELPSGADGTSSAHRSEATRATPWGSGSEPNRGTFVPPPVELVR
jgi:anthranilate synthase/aminodeoxychorismate synthase-like glutamine amidotransferase